MIRAPFRTCGTAPDARRASVEIQCGNPRVREGFSRLLFR